MEDEELFEVRAELELAYNEAHGKLMQVREVLAARKQEVLEFDAEHPEVMVAVKRILNQKKKEDGEREKAEAEAEAKAEDGDK